MESNRIKPSNSTNFKALHIIELAELPNTTQAVAEIVQTVKTAYPYPKSFIGKTSHLNGQGIRIATGTSEESSWMNRKIVKMVLKILDNLGLSNTLAQTVTKYQTYNPGEFSYGTPRMLETGNIILDIPPLSKMFYGIPEIFSPETIEEFNQNGDCVRSRVITYRGQLRAM